MEQKNSLGELMKITMEHIKTMADANTIIGTPIHAEGHGVFHQGRSSQGGLWRRLCRQRQAGAGGVSRCPGGRQREAAPGGSAPRHHRGPGH